MYYLGRILLIFSFLQISLLGDSENRIPFYEDYLKKGDLNGFLKVAERFLRENPDSVEGPRLAFDFLLVAKAAQDIDAIDFATSRLLFNFPNSLPTVHLLSSFDKRSPALLKLLKGKVDASDMENHEFAIILRIQEVFTHLDTNFTLLDILLETVNQDSERIARKCV